MEKSYALDYTGNRNLSYKEKGLLLTVLLDLDFEKFSIRELKERTTDSKNVILAIIKDLVKKDYVRKRIMRCNGSVKNLFYSLNIGVFLEEEEREFKRLLDERPYFVYILIDEKQESMKIGESCFPNQRKTSLEKEYKQKLDFLCVFRTNSNDFLEEAFHRYFSEYRIKGEWFEFNDEMRDDILGFNLPSIITNRIFKKLTTLEEFKQLP